MQAEGKYWVSLGGGSSIKQGCKEQRPHPFPDNKCPIGGRASGHHWETLLMLLYPVPLMVVCASPLTHKYGTKAGLDTLGITPKGGASPSFSPVSWGHMGLLRSLLTKGRGRGGMKVARGPG